MKVALGQIGAGPDKAQNLHRIATLAGKAAATGADLVLFPEAAMVGARPGESLAPSAEPLDGPFVSGLQQLASRHRMAVVAGMFEPAGSDRVYNTVVAVGGDGRLIGAYRKIHLYDAFGQRESDRIKSGDGQTLTFDGFLQSVSTAASVLPSGLNAIDQTSPMCPVSVLTSLREATSQIRTVP